MSLPSPSVSVTLRYPVTVRLCHPPSVRHRPSLSPSVIRSLAVFVTVRQSVTGPLCHPPAFRHWPSLPPSVSPSSAVSGKDPVQNPTAVLLQGSRVRSVLVEGMAAYGLRRAGNVSFSVKCSRSYSQPEGSTTRLRCAARPQLDSASIFNVM